MNEPTTAPLTTARKRHSPPVIVIAAGPAGRRWQRHLAAEGLTCRAVGDVAEAVELLADGPAAVIVVERPALEVGGPALMAAVRSSARLPVVLPVEAGARRPSPADCQRVIAAMRLARPAKRPVTMMHVRK